MPPQGGRLSRGERTLSTIVTRMEFEFEKKVLADITPSFKVGVITDSQLSPFFWKKMNTFERNLRRACMRMAALKPDILIFAGDICNIASNCAYGRFMRALGDAFKESKPHFAVIMGNHDYFPRPEIASLRRRKFIKNTAFPPFWHYVAGGYHFVGVSPDCGSLRRGYDRVAPALRHELDKAVAASGKRPVTLITHNAAKNTVYGSDKWGDESLDFLKNYPTVVHISGHLHYSMLDERSIHIGDFISLGAQSTAYVEMDGGMANGSVPPLAHDAAMGYLLEYSLSGIAVKRMNMVTGDEEKPAFRLNIPAQLDGDVLRSLQAARPAPGTPEMIAEAGLCEVEGGRTWLVFDRGKDGDFVHSFKVVYNTGQVQYYYSDFYRGLTRISPTMRLEVYRMPKGVYSADVYAINSAGAVSKTAVHIDDIKVLKRRRYPLMFAPDARYL